MNLRQKASDGSIAVGALDIQHDIPPPDCDRKYRAIGESDRMTPRFCKPVTAGD